MGVITGGRFSFSPTQGSEMLSSTSLHSSTASSSPLHFRKTLISENTLAKVSNTQPRRSDSTIYPASPVPLLHSIPTPGPLERLTRIPLNRAAAESQVSTVSLSRISSAADVVREFYDAINRRDLARIEPLFSEDCVYEDLIFSKPFVGRKAILDFFKKFTESISKDLQFVIDDISDEDSSAVGVTWHLEWQGRPFPFSKGCSFYRLMKLLNGRRQIVYGRDSVEPVTKPGELALILISGVTWLLERFPQLAERF